MAAEALTEAAVIARRQDLTIGIGIGPRTIGCRVGERLEAKLVGGLLEQRRSKGNLVWWLWIFLGTGPLERVAAWLDDAVDVARLARDAKGLVKLGVERLKLGVRDAPVLDG